MAVIIHGVANRISKEILTAGKYQQYIFTKQNLARIINKTWHWCSHMRNHSIGVAIWGNMATSLVMDQQYVQLMQQMVELPRENIALQKEGLLDRSGMSNVRKPERPTIESDTTDSDWARFMDSWTQYKEMCKLTRDLKQAKDDLFPQGEQVTIQPGGGQNAKFYHWGTNSTSNMAHHS